jgi:MFS family permease
VSIVTTIAYLGFLVGPAAVGLLADTASLRAALAAVGGLALLLAALVRIVPGPESLHSAFARPPATPNARSERPSSELRHRPESALKDGLR